MSCGALRERAAVPIHQLPGAARRAAREADKKASLWWLLMLALSL